ncbi:MAG: hypothetical protein IJW78_00465 [Clostridia bacterium]|nr:hypothetical protein [Clostridia bacterium]
MTEEFKIIIDDDIKKCEDEIINGNKQSRGKLHGILVSKYCSIIDGFEDGLHSLFYDNDGTYRKENLERMKEKLLLFKAMDYKNSYAKDENTGITVNNTNQFSATLNISFAEAKKQVEAMTSLRDEEIDEIHSKIDELEKIVASSDRKTKKWDKAKEIIKWIADKGIDVGLTLLPLVLKLGE